MRFFQDAASVHPCSCLDGPLLQRYIICPPRCLFHKKGGKRARASRGIRGADKLASIWSPAPYLSGDQASCKMSLTRLPLSPSRRCAMVVELREVGSLPWSSCSPQKSRQNIGFAASTYAWTMNQPSGPPTSMTHIHTSRPIVSFQPLSYTRTDSSYICHRFSL